MIHVSHNGSSLYHAVVFWLAIIHGKNVENAKVATTSLIGFCSSWFHFAPYLTPDARRDLSDLCRMIFDKFPLQKDSSEDLKALYQRLRSLL